MIIHYLYDLTSLHRHLVHLYHHHQHQANHNQCLVYLLLRCLWCIIIITSVGILSFHVLIVTWITTCFIVSIHQIDHVNHLHHHHHLQYQIASSMSSASTANASRYFDFSPPRLRRIYVCAFNSSITTIVMWFN